MSTIASWFQKVCLIGIVAAFALVAQPAVNVFALSPSDTITLPPPHPRLELAWKQEQRVYNRLGNFFDHVDERIVRGQELIDQAKTNGKDVTAVQAALNAFSDAVKQARPVYDSGNAIISSHAGFDASGNVTDQQQALQTVKNLRDNLKQIRDLITAPGKALRQAIQDFRQANSPASSLTPTSSAG